MGVELYNEYYKLAKFESKSSGVILANGVEIASTLQCPHCSTHFISRKGSGIKRSYCFLCTAVTCGSPQCIDHFPFEKKLDMYEKGLLKVLR